MGVPCPPVGRHPYFHKFYASETHARSRSAPEAEVEQAMEGHVLASTRPPGEDQRFLEMAPKLDSVP